MVQSEANSSTPPQPTAAPPPAPQERQLLPSPPSPAADRAPSFLQRLFREELTRHGLAPSVGPDSGAAIQERGQGAVDKTQPATVNSGPGTGLRDQEDDPQAATARVDRAVFADACGPVAAGLATPGAPPDLGQQRGPPFGTVEVPTVPGTAAVDSSVSILDRQALTLSDVSSQNQFKAAVNLGNDHSVRVEDPDGSETPCKRMTPDRLAPEVAPGARALSE